MSQSERCRRILAELSQRPEEDGGSPYTRLPISALVEAAAAPHQEHGVRLIFATAGAPAEDEPQVRRSPEILHGLNNLIQNAVQFADREVTVTTFWDPATVTVEISDDGPGFLIHLLGRLGEPYLSTRAGAADHMGLGIFIAQSLLERSGADARLRQSRRRRSPCCDFLEPCQSGNLRQDPSTRGIGAGPSLAGSRAAADARGEDDERDRSNHRPASRRGLRPRCAGCPRPSAPC